MISLIYAEEGWQLTYGRFSAEEVSEMCSDPIFVQLQQASARCLRGENKERNARLGEIHGCRGASVLAKSSAVLHCRCRGAINFV